MATILNFKEIIAWQKSEELAVKIYSEFKNCNDFSFRDQIQRASVSVMNNIAEGFDRKGNKEFTRFLYISKGSCAEVESMLELALKLGYISENSKVDLSSEAVGVNKMITKFIKSLNN